MNTVSEMWGEDVGHGLAAGAILALSVTTLALLFFRRTSKNPREAFPPPPGPYGLPLLGYLPFLGTDLHREFSKLANRYGPIFKLYLGNRQCVVISSPSLVKQVVRDQDVVFANHDLTIAGFVSSFGGNDIVLRPYGSEWKKLRKIFVREMLSNSILDNLYSVRREAVHKSIRQIYEKINYIGHDHDKMFDIGNLGFFTVANATLGMICSGDRAPVIDEAEFRNAASELMVLVGKPNVSDVFPALAWLDLQGIERDTKKVTRVFGIFLDSAIDQRKRIMKAEREKGGAVMKSSKEEIRKDFLQVLLEMHEKEDSAESISMAQLKAILMDIVVGGTDTTATTVEWTMAELLKHPEAMNKVHQELTQVVGFNNFVAESHLSKLTYLNAVIKETLRLHPPLPLLVPRYPSQSTTIGGYNVPKDTKIFVNVWALQRDPNNWENPLEFQPERFLKDDASKFDFSGNNFDFIPLGSGRRVCAGIPLVERMLHFVLASFLHSFEWKMPPGEKLELSDRFGIVVKKKKPLVVIPIPRLSNSELYA